MAKAQPFTVDVRPFGPSPEQLDRLRTTLLRERSVRRLAGTGQFRVLSVEAVDPNEETGQKGRPQPPTHYRAMIYDRENARTLIAYGRLDKPSDVRLAESAVQPPVTYHEFIEAVAQVQASPAFAPATASGDLVVYRPMPSLIDITEHDGRTRRVIAVGLFSRETRRPREILGVDVQESQLLRFANLGPAGSNPPSASVCGAPGDAGQATAPKGTAGQAWITVKQRGKTLWRFLAVRPAASSGLRGSGIELRFVDYRGTRVLYRAHVPILNVKYGDDACGPYRDWQWEEGQIQAQGTAPAPGFRLCPSPAQTIMETGSDTGNFLGVGVYVAGQEVVLVSEMEAGWYRYVIQWRLHANGTIAPRFGFAATDSPCVCHVHHHHAYWRFDFDIVSPGKNRVLEFNNPPLSGSNKWHDKHFEISRPRDPSRNRRWRVQHAPSGAAYDIVPGSEDGVATQQSDWPYGRGDVWILRYRGTEIDDGFNVTTSPDSYARLDDWVNGESVLNQDVVVWYGAHFTHDVGHDDPAQHGHVVGPDLVPIKWPS